MVGEGDDDIIGLRGCPVVITLEAKEDLSILSLVTMAVARIQAFLGSLAQIFELRCSSSPDGLIVGMTGLLRNLELGLCS